MFTHQLQQLISAAYGIQIDKAELLRDLDAQVYRIVDPAGNLFVLKDTRNIGSQRQAEIQAIVALTQAIRRQTAIAVPALCYSQTDQALMSYQTEQGEERSLVIYTWVEGELTSRCEPTPGMTYAMGEAAGWMHRCAAELTERFAIRVYDRAYVQRLGAETLAQWPAEVADQRAELQAAVRLLADKVEATGYTADCFGLIHADFHFGNLVITSQGEIGLIDFDEIAYGHYLFDLTNMINEFADYGELGPVLQDSFVCGYLAIRPEMQARFLDLSWFIALSNLVFVHWVFTTPGENVKRAKLQYIPDALAQLVTVSRGM